MYGGTRKPWDSACYRATRERASCVATARFSGSRRRTDGRFEIAVAHVLQRCKGVHAVADRLREPFGVGVAQPVRGCALKPVGIDAPV